MAHYLFQVAYTSESWASMLKDPQDRSAKIQDAIGKLGGKIERFWFSFGDYDVVGLIELPQPVDAAAFAFAVSAGGGCRSVKTTPLLSVADAVVAMGKARTCGYQPPRSSASGG